MFCMLIRETFKKFFPELSKNKNKNSGSLNTVKNVETILSGRVSNMRAEGLTSGSSGDTKIKP